MDADKVEKLYLKYAKKLVWVACNTTNDMQMAEDAVHQTFEKLLRMDDDKVEENDRMIAGLLRVMTRQAVYDQMQQKRKSVGEQIIDDNENGIEVMDDLTDLLEHILEKDFLSNLQKSLSWLDEIYSVPIIMRFVYEMKNEEIAGKLGLPKSQVALHIHRGLNKIRDYIKKGGEL